MSDPPPDGPWSITAAPEDAGSRLDRFMALRIGALSRSRVKGPDHPRLRAGGGRGCGRPGQRGAGRGGIRAASAGLRRCRAGCRGDPAQHLVRGPGPAGAGQAGRAGRAPGAGQSGWHAGECPAGPLRRRAGDRRRAAARHRAPPGQGHVGRDGRGQDRPGDGVARPGFRHPDAGTFLSRAVLGGCRPPPSARSRARSAAIRGTASAWPL